MATIDAYRHDQTGGTCDSYVYGWGSQTSTTSDDIWDIWATDSGTCCFYLGALGEASGQAQRYQEQAAARQMREVQQAHQQDPSRYQVYAQAQGSVHKVWIQEGLQDDIQNLYARNQVEINRIWQEIIAKEHQLEKEESERTAMNMLLDILGEEQFRVYEETGMLLVKGRRNDYLIDSKYQRVRKVTKDKIIPLCVHLEERYKYPETDNVIALAMSFKYDEGRTDRKANAGSGRPKGQLPKAANF